MTSTITATFKCRDCGSPVRWDGDLGDSQTVQCSGCGQSVGTLADIKRVTRAAARDHVRSAIKKAFRR